MRAIGLTDERYARLVVGVDEPSETVAAIRQALGTTGEGREPLASHKALVEAYIDGFRHSDHEAILACLADDVAWVLRATARSGARRPSMTRVRTTTPSAAPPCISTS